MPPLRTELIKLRVSSGVAMETQSGSIAAILMHPSSNFHGRYLLEPLAKRGVSTLALNSRYVNSDATLIMERVLLDPFNLGRIEP